MVSINWTTSPSDPWFKIGRLEVGSTMFVVLWVVVSWVAFVAAPGMVSLLGFTPQLVAQGELWRIVTWPLANGIGVWPVLNLFFFYVFGIEVEAQIGRTNMAKLLVGIWAALTVASALVMLLLARTPIPVDSALVGIGQVQFLLFLVWIFDNPNRPFFFNIPSWVIGVVFLGLQVMQYLAGRNLAGLLELLLVAFFVAVLARRLGLLGQYDWIPGRPTGRRPSRSQRKAHKAAGQRTQDSARLDQLLDKIGAQGMDSLTPAERRELMRLRNRRQG